MKFSPPGPSLSPSSNISSPSSKPSPGSFSPIGLHVLVVDDDPLCLMVLERMLRQCSYKVTTCNRVRPALQLLRENKDEFDLVLSDVYMPDEDGFKLLEVIGLELDLPVIMMSANGETSVVMQGITHGACDYLIKPIRMEELRNIWQHVIRRKGREVQRCSMQGELDEVARGTDSQDQGSKKRKDFFEMEECGMDGINSLKKARVNWSIELHRQFVDAVNQLNVDKAVPKRILEIMNVQGLTREKVASHLQKYRLYLKRLSGVVPEPCPIASFQAVGNGARGGSMKVQPAGKIPLSNAGVKGRNLGAGVGTGSGGKKNIDASTLESLAKYKLHQQQHAANRAQVLGGLGLSGPKFSLESPTGGLQRMASLDLNMFLQTQGMGCVIDQSMDPVDDLAAHNFQTVKLEEYDGVMFASERAPVMNSKTNPSGKISMQQVPVGQWGTGSTHHTSENTYKPGGAITGAAKDDVGEPGCFDAGESRHRDVSKVFLNEMGQTVSCTGGIKGNEVSIGSRVGDEAVMGTCTPTLTNVSSRHQPYVQAIPEGQSRGGVYTPVAPARVTHLGVVQSHSPYTPSVADFADDAVSSTNVDLLSRSTGTDVSGDAFSESSFSALAHLDTILSPPQLPPTSQLMQSAELDISDYLQLDDGLGFQC